MNIDFTVCILELEWLLPFKFQKSSTINWIAYMIIIKILFNKT